MYRGSASSVTQAENWAESATTLAPQIAATIKSRIGFAPNSKPINRQQLPLIAIAHEVTTVRPTRSAIRPAMTQPIAAHPITRNEATSASDESLFRSDKLARIINGIHVHMA